MKTRFCLPSILSLLLASCCQDTADGHARIRRLCPSPDIPHCVPMAQHSSTSWADSNCPPSDHASFTSHPAYPRTFRVWKDDIKMQASGPRHVEIDLARQRGIFVVNDEIVMDFPVCTGKKRKPTPTGRFRITQKNVHHHSNIYDVPMPYFMRLTNGGIGMHVGDVFRTPASHGCIRLTLEACVPLFRHAPSGTKVIIRHSGWTKEPYTTQPGSESAIVTSPHPGGEPHTKRSAESHQAAQSRQLANAAG